MAKRKAFISIGIFVVCVLGIILISAGIIAFWLSGHYKQILTARLPALITKSSDSVYHISFKDITVSLVDHNVTITDVKLWPDERQVAALRKMRHRTPPTLSTVSIPLIELKGITWGNVVSNKSFDCKNAIVHNLKWLLACTPHPEDSLFPHDKKKAPAINRITALHADFIAPDITYHFKGTSASFYCYMKGGSAVLEHFAYNYDRSRDTSTFLFAESGKLRPETFIFSKPSGRYFMKKPVLDFETTDKSITLKSVRIKHMINYDQKTAKEKEIYNLDFPKIELKAFNWNKLVFDGELLVPDGNASAPVIDIHYIRENGSVSSRKGSYPNQLLLQVGLKTNIEKLNIHGGHFKYTEVTKKGDEGVIEFTGIHGHFSNVTNIPAVIMQRKSCIADLEGKFANKSPVKARFDLSLADDKGRFKVDGYLENLDGDEVTPQAQVFTIVKVTSFHLKHMDMHIEGDESYGKGNFTVLYENLKISLFKFDTKMREGKKGLFAFVGGALVLYPDNPMPGKEVRKVSTSFARDTTKGFIGLLWQNIYRAAKKTAVRQQAIITLTDGPETTKGEKPKKGFFKRIFGKKK